MSAPPPFRAEHIGSLLRPKTLHAAFRRLSAGEITAADYRQVVDQAIEDVVRLQEDVGLQAVTDGEFRRASYWSHFVEAVDGYSVQASAYKFHDAEGRDHDFVAPYVERPIRRSRAISGGEFDFLKALTSRTPKITMPSPPTLHFWRGRDTLAPGSYANEEAYFADLVDVYRAEIADLAARGARYIQIDEVPLAMLCDSGVRQTIAGRGVDPARLAQRYVRLINDCLAAAPPEVTFGLHLCRGNFKGRWLSEGGYDTVAEIMFGEANVKAFFLEYDTDRAGGFAPLRFLPTHKHAVLGLVSSKVPQLESPDALKRRIDQAAVYAPLDRLAISPQCGFSSTIGGNPVTADDQRRKLDLVVRVAHDVWGSA
ncbi:MAG TPA: 5-methyltetrahydropteroyltriglutamate--homocysteine S-methyltransferase [Vineibacter sp.]|nr:5-methyltetrahydropteroyltriglutamate--homocysteine S-methyltransferase [Vineibacter sp.]